MDNPLHKWAATLTVVSSLLWGGLAYYVTSENTMLQLTIENRLLIIEAQQVEDKAVNVLVHNIDKKLTVIEQSIKHQESLLKEVRELREEVTELKIKLRIKDGNSST